MAGAHHHLPGAAPGTPQLLKLALWLLLSGVAAAGPWFPVDGVRTLREHPVHLRVQVPVTLAPYLNEDSLRRSADALGQSLELTTETHAPGYALGVLDVRLLEHPALHPEEGNALRTASSNEDGTFWVSLPAMEVLWDEVGWRYPDLTREQALRNKVTFAVKHELFVHLVGLAVETRRAIFRMDEYGARGYLDSAAQQDTFYDRPVQLRPDHPYIMWRRQLPANDTAPRHSGRPDRS